MAGVIQNGKPVNLANHFAFGLDQDLAQLNFILHAFGEVAFSPFTRIQRGFEGFGRDMVFFGIQRGFGQLLTNPQRRERQNA